LFGSRAYHTKVSPVLEWLAAMFSHISNRGEQMEGYYGFGHAVRDFITIGNPHNNYKMKILAL
jgi:hypothetical protein